MKIKQNYEIIVESSTKEDINKELHLREVYQLREDLAYMENSFREQYGNVTIGKYNKKFYDNDECELRDALTLIKNRQLRVL